MDLNLCVRLHIKTTQIYAKITKEKLNQDMENLAARLNTETQRRNPFAPHPQLDRAVQPL